MTEPGSTFRIYDNDSAYRRYECFSGNEFIANTPVELLDSEPVEVYYNNDGEGENAFGVEHYLFVKYLNEGA